MIKIIRTVIKILLLLLAIAIVSWGIIFNVNKHNNIYIGLGGFISKNDTLTLSLNVETFNKLSKGAGLESIQFFIWDRRLDGLDIFLESPSGVRVELVTTNRRGSNVYKNTILTDHADSLLFAVAKPYTKTYRPNQFLGWLNRDGKYHGKWKLKIVSRYPGHKTGVIGYWKLKFTDNPCENSLIENSPLPIIVIETNKRFINNKKKVKGVIYIINRDSAGFANIKDSAASLKSDIKIEIRGFSSVRMPKKSYSFRTVNSNKSNSDISILGLPADYDWILNANCMDRSMCRNSLMYELSRQMGYYSSRSRTAELVLNGQYMGVYILNEKIKRSPGRISDIDEFPKGMIVKLDTPRDNKPGWYSKHKGFDGKGYRCYFQYNYPSREDIDSSQAIYIQKKIDDFEDVTANVNSIDSLDKIINVRAFADFLLLQEFSKNADAFNLSIFLRLNKKQQIEIGPIWDYDRALGNALNNNARSTSGFRYTYADELTMHPTPMWWQDLMAKPQFRKLVKERWGELRTTVLSEMNIYSKLDSLTTLIEPVQERNFKTWPLLGVQRANFYGNPSLNTYDKEISDFKNWMHERLLWLDKSFSAL